MSTFGFDRQPSLTCAHEKSRPFRSGYPATSAGPAAVTRQLASPRQVNYPLGLPFDPTGRPAPFFPLARAATCAGVFRLPPFDPIQANQAEVNFAG